MNKLIYILFITLTFSGVNIFSQTQPAVSDSIPAVPYNFTPDQYGGLFLNGVTTEVVYDHETGKYIFVEKLGDYYVKKPIYMTSDEYQEYRLKRDMLDYYKSKVSAMDGKKEGSEAAKKDLLPKYYVNSKFFESLFGSNEVEVNLQGNVLISLGILYQKTENPRISERNRQSTTFDFDQQISASINAKVGTRLDVNINYDTQSTFDFQNLIKLEYTPTEDDIIQKIEVGNVSMPLQSSLIKGAQNLFGFKTKLQFGKTEITAVMAKQQSQTRSVAAQGGATIQEFELKASEYDNNRHFFLAQKFRDKYNDALINETNPSLGFPLINSSINITRVEVWVTNRNQATEDVRNIVAIADLAEGYDETNGTTNIGNTNVTINNGIHNPSNQVNSLYNLISTNTGDIRNLSTVNNALPTSQYGQGVDYSLLENAKKLIVGQDFSIHPTLGFISLNRALTESEVLAVAFEYSEFNSTTNQIETYQVGELTGNGIESPDNLVVKLLRPEIISTTAPMWDLMMKNVYDIRAYQMNPDGFRLEVLYNDPTTGTPINMLQNAQTTGVENKPLLNLLQIDRLDQANNYIASGDGYFDYVEGVTVNSQQGLIYFPQVEPFGDHLDGIQSNGLLTDPNDELFIFRELYELTQPDAQNNQQSKDKYILKGYYKSEGRNGIPLGAFNVPRGSVVVTTGGRNLVEGVDFVVDYQIGSVQIINPSLISSNAPIQVSVESNNAFSTQNRRFMGIDVQHKFSENMAIGGTFLNLRERPFTQKAQFGNEPVNNSIAGINFTYNSEIPKLTKWVNYLPNIDTDAPSTISIRAEAAYLLPNSPKAIELNGEAASYIDDFEGTQIPLNIDSPQQWYLASTPEGIPDLMGTETYTIPDPNDPNAVLDVSSNIQFSEKRAKLAWYSVDRLFYGSTLRPDEIDEDDLSRAETRTVGFEEIFPNQDLDITQSNIVRTFDLAYYPKERGQYNYGTEDVDDNTGKFTNPEDKWGGIMRALTTTDFQQANVEYIQFWMMNPYENYSITPGEGADTATPNPTDFDGELYFNLGNISEDILHDGRRMYENGLPDDGNQITAIGPNQNVDYTSYSQIPTTQVLLNAFDEDDNHRLNQDIGLDGLNDTNEQIKYASFINGLNGNANSLALQDPSSDNYVFYRNGDYNGNGNSILARYKHYNNMENNTPTLNQSGDIPTAATPYPDAEDINRDQTLSTTESYFQYKVPLNPTDFVVGQNNIVDSKITTVNLPNGDTQTSTWYQYRIPVQTGAQAINGISSFNSIRFMRMYLTKFKIPIVLRFANLELVRGNWRRYTYTLDEPTPSPLIELTPQQNQSFEVGVVNIQENENRTPIPYVLPPGVQRERLQGSTSIQQQNEQSLSLKVKGLEAGETRLVYKNTVFDMRMFKKLKMFVHAEKINSLDSLEDDEISAVVRLGSDITDNYYQIEVPLKITDHDATTAEEIWLNNLEAALEEFGKLRLKRFENGEAPNVLYPTNGEIFDNFTLYVKGNPNLGDVETLMLGIKNTSLTPKSAEVWFNELRVVDFDNEGGWSAVVNANANLADFADVAVTGAMSTQGFGSLDQRVNERSQQDTKLYDVVSNINLGQLLPKKTGIKLPLNVSIAEEIKDPKYDPQYQDVLFEDTNIVNSPNRDNASDYTKRRSISLINVRKERTNNKKKQRLYDVENFTASIAYNDTYHKDYNVERYLDKNVRASATYNFTFDSKPIEPFKNATYLGKSKYVKWIKDFNLNLVPKNFGVNSNIIRSYNEQLARPLVDGYTPLPALERRNYAFDWDYNLAYDLTKSISFNFRAANSYIRDDFDKDTDNRIINGEIFDKFFVIGRPNHYHQKLEGSYKIPLNKLPIFDFVTATYNYTADFDWQASSSDIVESVGNTIQNANTHSLNADLNMNKLYNKLGVNKLYRNKGNKKRAKALKKAKKKQEKERKKLAKQKEKESENSELTEGKSSKETKKNKKKDLGRTIATNKNTKSRTPRLNRKKLSFPKKFVLGAVDVLTSVKKIRMSYTENNGTFLPGYSPEIGFLGRDNYSGSLAPTLGFVFGSQQDMLNRAYRNDWLVSRATINDPFFSKTFSKTHFEDLKFNVDVKPFKNFKIDVQASKTKTRNLSQQIDIIDNQGTGYDPFDSPITETGNFAISNIMIGTAFKNSDQLFQDFLTNRNIIANRLANETNGDLDGFGVNNQRVLLPAFFATYSGRKTNKVKLGSFKNIPLPNWRVSYKGLSKIKALKKIFRTITIEHGYQSSYSILGFNSNLLYNSNAPYPTAATDRDLSNNYINKLSFQGVNLVEQFNPLIKLDVKFKNSLSFRGEIKKDRSLALNFSNSSITEIDGKEYVVGLGYKLKDVKWRMKLGDNKTTFKGDINLKADFGIRDDITVIRSIQNETDQITGGQRIFTLKFTADYNLNKNLMASFFWDQNSSRFKISTTFPRNSISAGISLRYNLGN